MEAISRDELERYTCSEKIFFWIKRIIFYLYVPLVGILLLIFLCQQIMVNNKILNDCVINQEGI